MITWRSRLLTALLASVLALLGVELAIRALSARPSACDQLAPLLRPLPPPRRYGLTPSWRGERWGMRIAINTLGFRGPEPLRADRGEPVILVAGDSVTFGVGVRWEDLFTSQLERILATQAETAGAAGSSPTVANLGVPGYDSVQEVATLQRLLPRLAANTIVLQYSPNDVEVASPALAHVRGVQQLCGPLARRSRLAQWVRQRLYRRQFDDFYAWANEPDNYRQMFADEIRAIPPSDAPTHRVVARIREQIAATDFPAARYGDLDRVGRLRYAFDELAALARRHRLRVLIATMPLLQPSPSVELALEVVRYETVRRGFIYVDLSPRLAEHGLEDCRLPDRRQDNVHPNRDCHRLIAETLAKRLGPATVPRASRPSRE